MRNPFAVKIEQGPSCIGCTEGQHFSLTGTTGMEPGVWEKSQLFWLNYRRTIFTAVLMLPVLSGLVSCAQAINTAVPTLDPVTATAWAQRLGDTVKDLAPTLPAPITMIVEKGTELHQWIKVFLSQPEIGVISASNNPTTQVTSLADPSATCIAPLGQFTLEAGQVLSPNAVVATPSIAACFREFAGWVASGGARVTVSP